MASNRANDSNRGRRWLVVPGDLQRSRSGQPAVDEDQMVVQSVARVTEILGANSGTRTNLGTDYGSRST